MADIARLVLADHSRIRRLEAALRAADRRCGAEPTWMLPSAWQHLATVIEEHLRAAEKICWPALSGTGPQGQAQVRQMTSAATQIRAAIAAAQVQAPASPGWWQATSEALTACAGHIEGEEHALLARFGQYASLPIREQIGRQWLALRTTPAPLKRPAEAPES